MRSTARTTGVAFDTVQELLIDAGRASARFPHDALRTLTCRRLQLDEVWSFCDAKGRNVETVTRPQPGVGSAWTWIAIDAETPWVPSWLVGLRDGDHARAFVCDLAERLANRVQITTDGLRAYVEAMEAGFGGQVDSAVLPKGYGNPTPDESRYSPPECVGCQRHAREGRPDVAAAATSYIARQNLPPRMRTRRFPRRTNAFSKTLGNHGHAVALSFFAYNFLFRHATLRMPPAPRAGVTDHW